MDMIESIEESTNIERLEKLGIPDKDWADGMIKVKMTWEKNNEE